MLSLKSIFLKKINTIINPDFDKVVVRSIIALGCSSIGLGLAGVSSFGANLTVEYKWLRFVLEFSENHNTTLVAIGILLIVVALIFRYFVLKNESSLNSPDKSITILNNLKSDITNSLYTESQKQLIIKNRLNELNQQYKSPIILPNNYRNLAIGRVLVFIEDEVLKRNSE